MGCSRNGLTRSSHLKDLTSATTLISSSGISIRTYLLLQITILSTLAGFTNIKILEMNYLLKRSNILTFTSTKPLMDMSYCVMFPQMMIMAHNGRLLSQKNSGTAHQVVSYTSCSSWKQTFQNDSTFMLLPSRHQTTS